MKYVIIDCETGGFDPSKDSLLSVAMIKVTTNYQIIDDLYIKIRHGTMHITPESLEHNGIDVNEALSWVPATDARKKILEFLDAGPDIETATTRPSYIGIGTNILFDIPFLKAFLGHKTVDNLIFHRVEEITSNFRELQKTGVVPEPAGYRLWQILRALDLDIDPTKKYTAQDHALFALKAAREMHLRSQLLGAALTAYVKRHGGELNHVLKAYRSKDRKKALKHLQSKQS